MKLKGFLLLSVMLFTLGGAAWGQRVEIDHVDGTNPDGTLKTGEFITFTIRLIGDENTHSVINNGFRVHSPDGAQWNTTVPDTLPNLLGYFFPSPIGIYSFSCDGSGADTVGFCGIDMAGDGMSAYFDDNVYTIEIGPIDALSSGKTIVVDSSLYPPAGTWVWGDVEVIPEWGGPYEYTIDDHSDDPFAYHVPGIIVIKLPVKGFIDIYFGNFNDWGKDVDDVDLKSIKIDAVKPRSVSIVQQDPEYGLPAIKAVVPLKNLLKPYEPLVQGVYAIFNVSGKFLDKQRFSIQGDLAVEIVPGYATDLNGDGATDKTDLDMLVTYLYHSPNATPNDPAYDVDGSGQVDVNDYLELKKLIAEE